MHVVSESMHLSRLQHQLQTVYRNIQQSSFSKVSSSLPPIYQPESITRVQAGHQLFTILLIDIFNQGKGSL